jgi:hypothetical protein
MEMPDWREASDYLAWLNNNKLIDKLLNNELHTDIRLTNTHSKQEQAAIQKLINLNLERFVAWRVKKRLTGM